jgi:hypothetical protein
MLNPLSALFLMATMFVSLHMAKLDQGRHTQWFVKHINNFLNLYEKIN